jgi:formate dehydrogenase major subunit
VQWRYKGIQPPGEARDDLWIINMLMFKLKQFYETEGGPNADAITNLIWEYGDPPDVHKVAKEMNGYDLKTGKLLSNSTKLKANGTTSSGNWILCGSYTEEGNMTARRDPSPGPFNIGLFPKWAWAWPLNRRIWYNRASVDLEGKPWDPNRPVIKWEPLLEKWIGDAPDGGWPPVSISGKYPFIMKPQGRAHLFGPGRLDGPFPEHYEPWESPAKNLMTSQQSDPVLKLWNWDKKGTPDRYPILATTFRVVEHLHTGSFTRNLPWLVELMPEMFIEISEELAKEKGITNGGKTIIESTRGEIQAIAIVTKRLHPFSFNGGKIHQIAMPWCYGYMGLSKGDSANLLTANIADANTGIPEFRAFLCNIRAK